LRELRQFALGRLAPVLASLIDQAERMLPEHALPALDTGATWHDIVTALATSPEQAELRYSPDSPIADNRWPFHCHEAQRFDPYKTLETEDR
jgi:hypothetical protein